MALSILPHGVAVLMSVSAAADLTRVPLEWLPRQWDFSRYARLLSLQPGEPGALFLPALRNSLLVAAGATLVSLLLAVPAAFSFSRYPDATAGCTPGSASIWCRRWPRLCRSILFSNISGC